MPDGPLTPLLDQRGKTDENGYLLVSLQTKGALETPLTPILQLRVRIDSNGYILVAQ